MCFESKSSYLPHKLYSLMISFQIFIINYQLWFFFPGTLQNRFGFVWVWLSDFFNHNICSNFICCYHFIFSRQVEPIKQVTISTLKMQNLLVCVYRCRALNQSQTLEQPSPKQLKACETNLPPILKTPSWLLRPRTCPWLKHLQKILRKKAQQ